MWCADKAGANWIQCSKCLCSTIQRFSIMDDCRPLLAEAWNRRSAPAIAADTADAARYRELREQHEGRDSGESLCVFQPDSSLDCLNPVGAMPGELDAVLDAAISIRQQATLRRMTTMTSHELARLLLTLPDLPVATHANNHTARCDSPAWGLLKVGRLNRDQIIVGNFSRKRINYPNDHIVEVYTDGERATPEDWW
jgi:hypothetical protein